MVIKKGFYVKTISKHHLILLAISLVFLLMIVFVFVHSCSGPKKVVEPEAKLVKSMLIQSNQNIFNRTLPGKVYANQKVDLSFQVTGTLNELPIREGMLVKKHQLIGRLDPRDYQISVANAKAKYENANSLLKRYKQLLDTKYLSPADYEQQKMKMEVTKADLDKADKDLSDTYLYAPFEGLIAKQYVNNFEYVQAKTPIISLQDSEDIEIHIDMSEQDFALTGGLENLNNAVETKRTVAYVSFPALSKAEYPVTLKEYATEANPKTQTFLFKLTMPKIKDIPILPGMTALARFVKSGTNVQSFNVPLSAVNVDINGKYYVWIITPAANKATKRIVTVGKVEGENIQILNGLSIGDRIITAGTKLVEEGMKVRPMPDASNTNQSNRP